MLIEQLVTLLLEAAQVVAQVGLHLLAPHLIPSGALAEIELNNKLDVAG